MERKALSIHLLPPELVARIAAGEVIERPAFVVKELIENSLDAGATQITLEVMKGGLSSITVIDNGQGMTPDDLMLSWQQHTTSKLPPDSDLTIIEHLGFRGEALSSIAAVSSLTIQSRQHNEPGGNLIHIHNGKFQESTVVGMAPGTIVRVEQLFAGLPGRQKFFASAQSEWHSIMRIIEGQALSHPEVQFRVFHNGREIFQAPVQSFEERMRGMLGAEVTAQSFPFSLEDPYASVQGFLGTPQLSFQTNIPSYLIVNRRVVKNRALIQALKESYRGLLKVDATPFFLLNLTVPLQTVDVNIHPRKEEVKFLNERELSQALATGIASAAREQNLSYRWATPQGDTKSFAAKAVRTDVLAGLRTITQSTPTIQLHDLYIVTATSQGFVIIDQHAAHERILYEQLSESYQKLQSEKRVRHLKKPKLLSLPLSQGALLETHRETLERLGFEIEAKTPTTFHLHALPEIFQDRDVLQLFQELLRDLEENESLRIIDKHTNRMLSFLACRMAIKGGESLSEERMRQLLIELANTKTSYACPHGRPTHVEFSLTELEKIFGRT